MMLHGACVAGESRSTKLFFSCKVASAGDGPVCDGCGCGCCDRDRFLLDLCSAMSGCSCVRDSMRLLTLWLQIAM